MPFTAYEIGGRSWLRHRVSWPSELTFSDVRALSAATSDWPRSAAKSRTVAVIRDRSPTLRRISRTERNLPLPAGSSPCARAGAGATARPTYIMSNQQVAACRSVARMERVDGTRIADRTGQTGRGSRRSSTGRGSRGSHGTPIARISDHDRQPGVARLARRSRRRSARSASAAVAEPDPRDPRLASASDPAIRAIGIRDAIRDPRFVNTSVRRCSVRNRLAISIQPVGQSNSTGTRKCACPATRADAARACRFLTRFAPQIRRNLRETTGV